MSTINTLLIKRRLPDSNLTSLPVLSGGELAFSEKNYTLYYGASGLGAIPIAGPGAFVDRTTDQSISGNKTFDNFATFNKGVTVYSGLTADNIRSTGDLTVDGNLNVLGSTTTLETTTTVASSFNITNVGSDTALTVNQTGEQPVANFKDDGSSALFISGTTAKPGYVGIGTETPNEKLTVSGSISASSNFYAVNGDFTGTLDVDSATTLNSTLFVTGSTTINNTLSATGAVDFDSSLNVDGNTTLQGDLSGTGSSNIVGFVIDGGSF
jgi:cytoskeletal protein CcmA (bactofilin family)